MKQYFTLSKKEREVMDIFWEAGAPLSRQEILERAAEKRCSWKPNSVHILVNALMEKGMLRVAGFFLNSRKLGRTFEAAMTLEEYVVMQVEASLAAAKRECGLESVSLLEKLAQNHGEQ